MRVLMMKIIRMLAWAFFYFIVFVPLVLVVSMLVAAFIGIVLASLFLVIGAVIMWPGWSAGAAIFYESDARRKT